MARKQYSDKDVLNLLRLIELSLASGRNVCFAPNSGYWSDALDSREKRPVLLNDHLGG